MNLRILKTLACIFQVCNLSRSSQILATLVPVWFIVTSLPLVIFYLSFYGFLRFEGDFVHRKKND